VDRRRFLAGLLPAVSLGYPRSAATRTPAARLEVVPLGEKLWLITGAGGHVTVLQTSAGVLLIDGGVANHSAALLQQVRQLTGARTVHSLFNTHWHHDQIGCNAPLAATGTRIIAHENTRLWLTTEVESAWEQRRYPPLPRLALPNRTFYSTETFRFGDEQLDAGYLPQAHTDGDIYVYLRNRNVLVGGDVLSKGAFPIIDYATNGWIGGLLAATQTLAELGNAETKYVPGHGPLLSLEDVRAEQAMLATMRTRLANLLTQGMSAREMVAAAPAQDFTAQWGDATLFVANAWPGLVQRARELGVSIV
jgi:cyclase